MRLKYVWRGSLLTIAALASSATFASNARADGLIHSCVNAFGGIHIVVPPMTCGTGEIPLNWNASGPTGPKGDQGDKGDHGDRGDDGTMATMATMAGQARLGLQGHRGLQAHQGRQDQPRTPGSRTATREQHPPLNFLGTIDNNPLELKVFSQRALRLEPNAVSPNLIGGSGANSVVGAFGATIAGGGSAAGPNAVTANFGTIGGGNGNSAMDVGATVGGGIFNGASGPSATVAGGESNLAIGASSSIGGGINNNASGLSSSVAGGDGNNAGALRVEHRRRQRQQRRGLVLDHRGWHGQHRRRRPFEHRRRPVQQHCRRRLQHRRRRLQYCRRFERHRRWWRFQHAHGSNSLAAGTTAGAAQRHVCLGRQQAVRLPFESGRRVRGPCHGRRPLRNRGRRRATRLAVLSSLQRAPGKARATGP